MPVLRTRFAPPLLAAIFVVAPAARAGAPTDLIAEHFHRPAAEIESLHGKGLSYAEIVKILVIAQMSKLPVPDLLEKNRKGRGWGTVSRELGLDTVEVKRSFDEARRAIRPSARPGRMARSRPRAAPRERIWELDAFGGVTFDGNIRRFLVNSASDANPPLPDSVMRSGAGLALAPRLGENLESRFAYVYDRYDFAQHKSFSYYNHSLSTSLSPKLCSSLSLDTGADFDWTNDKDRGVANSQAGSAGIIWRAARRLRVKAGYEYRNDNVLAQHLKDARSNIAYFSFYQRFLKNQLGFGSYRYRANAAAGDDYSYKSHSARLGIVSHWASSFKTTLSGSLVDKRYDNMDSRFLQTRRDKTYSAMIRPALTFWRWFEASASFTYLQNRSNVSIKSYSDRVYSLGLEGRF